MGKSIFEKYEELLSQSEFDESSMIFGSSGGKVYDPNDDESEDFLTSKEIVKIKEERKETEDGIVLPTGPVEIEEDVHFKRYSKRRVHKYTEKELEEITKSCEASIVHDYSEFDSYHISDEERARNDSLIELRIKLGGLRRMYRRIDQYIEAMRVVIQAWEILEKKDNYIHSSEEFYRLVASGNIFNTSIIMPKMKGLDKFNLDLVVKYISNPELDPTDLIPVDQNKRDSFYDQFDEDDDIESEEEEMERLLSPEEVQYILDNIDNPPSMKVHDIKPKFIKGYDHKSFGDKGKNKFNKKTRFMVDNLHDILNKIQSNPANRDGGFDSPRSFLITNSIFEPQKKEHDFWDDLYFDGSWTSEADLFVYDLAVREEILKQHAPNERYISYGDRELQMFFSLMEENGLNVVELRRRMNMSEESLRDRESKKVKKENKKIESALLQRITKLNNSPKFKKLITKAEKAINEQMNEY